MKLLLRALRVFVVSLSIAAPAAAQPRPLLKVGITLHPYYSWTKNVVGTLPGYELRTSVPRSVRPSTHETDCIMC